MERHLAAGSAQSSIFHHSPAITPRALLNIDNFNSEANFDCTTYCLLFMASSVNRKHDESMRRIMEIT